MAMHQCKPLRNGATEMDDRGQTYSMWLEQQIVDHVTAANFCIGANKSSRCPLHIARCILVRGFQFHTKETMRHLVKCKSGTTTDIRWMVLQRAEELRSGALRSPFSLRKFAQAITRSFSSQKNHEMGAHRLRQKKKPRFILFCFQINCHA